MLRDLLAAAWDVGLITPAHVERLRSLVKTSRSAQAAQALATYVRTQEAYNRREATVVEVVQSYEALLVSLHGSVGELRHVAGGIRAVLTRDSVNEQPSRLPIDSASQSGRRAPRRRRRV